VRRTAGAAFHRGGGRKPLSRESGGTIAESESGWLYILQSAACSIFSQKAKKSCEISKYQSVNSKYMTLA